MHEVSKPPVMSRRRSPRVEVGDELSITFAESASPVRVRDVSFGGFALETPTPVRVGESQLFKLRTPSEPMLFVTARATYCRKLPHRDAYVSGWAAGSERGKQTLMDAITAVTGTVTVD